MTKRQESVTVAVILSWVWVCVALHVIGRKPMQEKIAIDEAFDAALPDFQAVASLHERAEDRLAEVRAMKDGHVEG